jgi:glycosyltransferase involved in cell wall biosynthesis
MTRVAIVHDYLTQRGGAERVALAMARAFPGAPVYTSLYDKQSTFPEFQAIDVRPTWLNRIALLRGRHRLALPLLAPAFSATTVDADVVLCSTSGWAHGIGTSSPKVVYCHTPARWLYDGHRYLGGRIGIGALSLAMLRPSLVRWDRQSARSARRYLANSNVVKDRIRKVYGIEADVLPPPPALLPEGHQRPPDEVLEPGFFLCVARLLPYKNVDAVVEAFHALTTERLVVVGTGPEARRLASRASARVSFAGAVDDDELRWLYANCSGVVAASFEDYGLTPLEAASFGKPAVVLRAGGFLDTVDEGSTGLFFAQPDAGSIGGTVRACASRAWDERTLRGHAERFSQQRFAERLREVVRDEAERC